MLSTMYFCSTKVLLVSLLYSLTDVSFPHFPDVFQMIVPFLLHFFKPQMDLDREGRTSGQWVPTISTLSPPNTYLISVVAT